METKIEPKEQDLFKITTIKKKHAEQVRVPPSYDTKVDFTGYQILGYITIWSGVLVKDTDGHFAVYSSSQYADWLVKAENLNHVDAYKKASSLPQLFLD